MMPAPNLSNAFPPPGSPQGFAPRARPPAYYRHSGKAPPLGLAIGLGGGLVAGAVLALVYAYALAYIPVIGYVTFLLSAAFGAGAGAIPALAMRKGNVRSTAATFVVSGIVILASFYVSWATWCAAVLGRANIDTSALDLVASPATLWEVIGRINEVGAWSLRGATPTGTVLWVLWSLEFVLIVGAGLLAAGAAAGLDPFCEQCGTWTKAFDRLFALPPGDQAELRGRVEAREWGWLVANGSFPRTGGAWYDVGLHVCEKCGTTNTLTVERVTQTTNAKGEVSESRDFVVDRLLIDAQEANGIRQSVASAPVPAAPSFTSTP